MAEQRRKTRITDQTRQAFLDALAAGWSITKAAAAAGSCKQRFYELRQADEAFAEQWGLAYDAGTDVLRDEIRRRAVDGWDEPVFQKGGQVGVVRKFSDQLLMFEAKRRDPGYRDNHRVELTGADGGPIVTEDRSASLAEIAEVLQQTGALPATDGG